MIIIRMPWESPPLRSNQRLHWAKKAGETRYVREMSAQISKTHRGKGVIMGPVVVTLIWEVTDHRRRDVGAASPTLKAWIDGMVDGGLLAGDHHEIVTEERLRIEYGPRKGVRVEVESA